MDKLEQPAVFVVESHGNWYGTAVVLVEAHSYKEAEEKVAKAYPKGIQNHTDQEDPVVFTDGVSKPYAFFE